MFGFTRTSVFLIVYFTIIQDCYSTKVTDNNEEYFEAGKLHLEKTTHSNLYFINNFRVENDRKNISMGFSVSTLKSLRVKEFTGCYLQEEYLEGSSEQVIFFVMDFDNNQVQINCSSAWKNLYIYENEFSKESDKTSETTFKPLTMRKVKSDEKYSYFNFQFYIQFDKTDQIYGFYFHNCDGSNVSYNLQNVIRSLSDDLNEEYPVPYYPKRSYDVYTILIGITMGCCLLMLGFYWVYVYKTNQNTLKNFHYVLPIIVFHEAFLSFLSAFKLHTLEMSPNGQELWLITVPLIDLTESLKNCCIITLALQGWIYVKNIFGRIERYFLMSILIVQTVLWISVYIFTKLKSNNIVNYKTDYLQLIEFLVVPVVLVYLAFRRADWRKYKVVGNSKKFQLFRFVYFLAEFFVYILPFSVVILCFHLEEDHLPIVYWDHRAFIYFMFYVILFYKLRPKIIKEIAAEDSPVPI